MAEAKLLYDPNACVIRFAQLKFKLTGDLSGNRIIDSSGNYFSEFNLDDQNNFEKQEGYTTDISFNSWKNYFYNGHLLKNYNKSMFSDLKISDISGSIVFIKDVSNNSISTANTDYITNIFQEITTHIVSSKNISSIQHLSTDSLFYLVEMFGGSYSLQDLCRRLKFVWNYNGLDLDNITRLMAVRYDEINTGSTAINLFNNDTNNTVGKRWDAVSALFSNPESEVDFKKKNVLVCFFYFIYQ